MKSMHAPLYVMGYDLLTWLVAHVSKLPRSQRYFIGERMRGAAADFVDNISLALHSRHRRGERLEAADAALMRLRVAVRLAGDAGLLTPKQRKFLRPQLNTLGRMLGGWLKQERRHAARMCEGDDLEAGSEE